MVAQENLGADMAMNDHIMKRNPQIPKCIEKRQHCTFTFGDPN